MDGNTSLAEGALIPLEGLISLGKRQGTIVLTNDTVMALTEHCKIHTRYQPDKSICPRIERRLHGIGHRQ
jgi:hypothetical protein